MQITLDSSEIKCALINYVRDQGIDLTNTDVEVGMTAGRGANGTTATVDIIPKTKATGDLGVKTTFHNVDNLVNTPLPKAAELLDPPIADTQPTEEVLVEEVTQEPVEEPVVEEDTTPTTSSIFK